MRAKTPSGYSHLGLQKGGLGTDRQFTRSLKRRLENETLKPAITIGVGGTSLSVSIESIDLSASSVGVGQKFSKAELRNHGSKSAYDGDYQSGSS